MIANGSASANLRGFLAWNRREDILVFAMTVYTYCQTFKSSSSSLCTRNLIA